MDENSRALRRIKLLHTVVWAFFAGAIVLLLFAALLGQIQTAAVLIGVVSVELVILAIYGGKCPLTGVAARYTDDRRDNFDIYLPLWLARYNKQIFGALFLIGVAITVAAWRGWLP